MSGCSYNCLFLIKSEDIFDQALLNQISDMARALETLGCSEAAKATEEIKDLSILHFYKMSEMLTNLKNVWKAVELHEDGEWDIEQIYKASKKYEKHLNKHGV